jgi:hypothetical protein
VSNEGAQEGKFKAVLLTITKVRGVSQDLLPFVQFRARMEEREPQPEDDVAIFNVHGTGSHFVIFLDTGKTMDDVDEEIVPYNVVISTPDRQRIATDLESKALLKEALG